MTLEYPWLMQAPGGRPCPSELMYSGDVHPNSTYWHGLSPAGYWYAVEQWKKKHPGQKEPTAEDYNPANDRW